MAPKNNPNQRPKQRSPKRKQCLCQMNKKYLYDWLFDPSHVLNPYPTDEEKSTIMKDTGIERSRLDSWFMKNRQKVLNPEIQPVKMKWNEQDRDHWTNFRKNRFMLEATADLLLMYAHTTTFFGWNPFAIYARNWEMKSHVTFRCNVKSVLVQLQMWLTLVEVTSLRTLLPKC
ncbi:hypothetical protein ACHAW5_007694 [Stephanodiscus triporus]|uniref:Homeobox domain-containing protein n=1 Tax=Stephanodiscus triporus TaxID=2934178 RepID=A0ABD3Q858_9STRA